MDIMLFVLHILHFTVLAHARYSLFKDHLRIPAKYLLPVILLPLLLFSFVWYLLSGGTFEAFVIYRFASTILMFGLSCLLITAPFPKHALSYITILAYDIFIETVATCIAALLPREWIPGAQTALRFLLLLLTIYPVTVLVRWITEQLSTMGSEKVWNYLCICGFSIIFIALLKLYPTGNGLIPDLLCGVVLLCALFGMYGAAIRIQVGLKKAADTSQALDMANRQVDMQQDYYDHLISQMEEIRHIRHDLRHHRAALMALIKSGNTRAAEEYMQDWEILERGLPVTGNLAADSLINYYYNKAKDLGFTLETELALAQLPPVSEPDLCVLIGNLLENALDAQEYLPPQSRFVRICARSDADSLTLAVDNRFDGNVIKEGERFLTRKEDKGHGIGLASVRAICKKYNGVLQLETEGDLFMAGVVIGL